MNAALKRGRNEEDRGSGEPSLKRTYVGGVPVELDDGGVPVDSDDGIFVLPYSSELRKSQLYVEVEKNIKMGFEDFMEALNNKNGTDEQIEELLMFLQSSVITAEQRLQVKNRLNITFSRAEFAQVARFYGLNPSATNEEDAGFETCSIPPMRLPQSIFKKILHQLDSKFSQYGWPWEQENETARNYCIAEIFSPILDNFKGVFIDKAEVLMELDVSRKRGRAEHRWLAFQSICVEYEELKFEQKVGKNKLKALAQMILEADACAFENDMHGFCVPIIGIMVAPDTMEALVYHPDSRKFHLSKPVGGFTTARDNQALLSSIRRMADHIYGLLVAAYINSLDAFLQKSQMLAKKEKAPRESTGQWQDASVLARKALKLGREAMAILRDPKGMTNITEQIEQVNEKSQQALQILTESVEKSPRYSERQSLYELYHNNEATLLESEMLAEKALSMSSKVAS